MENRKIDESSRDKTPNKSLGQNELCLVGIFHSFKKGILLVRKNNDEYQLPGGIFQLTTDTRSFVKQPEREEEEIKKLIFEQSGHLFEIKTPIAHFNFVDRGIAYKAFYLASGQSIRKEQWIRKKEFYYNFLLPSQIENARIKYEDKQIIFYYLLNQAAIKAKDKPKSPFTSVIAVAD
jgi:hypothetical protein